MDQPTINPELTLTAADHQIFLSFVNDREAEMFYAWWTTKGFEAFSKWADDED